MDKSSVTTSDVISTKSGNFTSLDSRIFWITASAVALLVVNLIAFQQAPHPDPFQPGALFSKHWFIYPMEQNAFKRLPVIDAKINDINGPRNDKDLLVLVGDAGFIARSTDGGISWETIKRSDGLASNQQSGLLDFLIPSAQAADANAYDTSNAPQLKKVYRSNVEEQTNSSRINKADVSQVVQKADSQDVRQYTDQAAKSNSDEKQISSDDSGNLPPKGDSENDIPSKNAEPVLNKIFFADRDHAWVVGERGTILNSTDGGQTWQHQDSGTDSDLNALFFADAQTGWIAGDSGILLGTRDGGKTWQRQNSGTVTRLFSISFVDSKTGWAGGMLGKLLHTGDGGQTWQPQSSGTVASIEALSFTDGLTGWIAGGYGTLLHTRDGGQTWQPQTSGTESTLSSLFFTDNRSGWAAGTNGVLLHTRDGGTSWQPQNSGTSASLKALYLTDSQTGWTASAGGILHTRDGGTSWRPQATGNESWLFAVTFSDSNNGWAAGGNGTLLHTDDGGRTWESQISGTNDWLSSLAFTDNQTAWMAGNNGTLLHTRDGGQSWQTQNSGTDAWLRSLDFIDSQTGWASGSKGTLLHTRDGGQVWQPQISGTNSWLYSLAFTDNQTGWVAGSNGTLLHTRDGGQTWQPQNTGTKAVLSSLYFFTDGETGWAAGSNGTLLHTRNGGQTWENLKTGTTEWLYSLNFTDRLTGSASGSNGTLLHTSDGGITWQPQQTLETTAGLYSLSFTDSRTGWVVGGNSTLLRTTDGGATWTDVAYSRFPAPWYYLATFASLLLLAPALRAPRPLTGEKSIADMMASDSPLKPGDPDPLQFGAIARSLSRFIRNENTRPPLTIAITGPWGSGKSSLMNLISGDLQQVGFRPVWFNVWHHQKEEHLLAALLANIRRQAVPPFFSPWPPFINFDGLRFRYRLLIHRGPRHWLLWAVTLLVLAISAPIAHQSFKGIEDFAAFRSYLTQLFLQGDFGNLDVVVFLSALATGVGTLLKTISAFGISPTRLMAGVDAQNGRAGKLEGRLSFRHQFAEEFRDVTNALDPLTMVIMIDDLDRCRSGRVLEILEAVNFLVSSGNCIVIMGMDYDVIRQSIALEFKDLAEQIKKEDPSNGDTKAELFAAEYLEKLVNIQVPVPQLDTIDAAQVMAPQSFKPATLQLWMQRFKSFCKSMAPFAVVALVLTLGWKIGSEFTSNEGAGAKSQFAGNTVNAAAQQVITGKPSAEATGPIDEPKRDSESQTGKIIVASQYISPWYYYTAIPVALLLLAIITIALRRRMVVVKDSQEFDRALKTWAEVITRRRSTPRSIKRFLNRTRYFAMRLRDNEFFADDKTAAKFVDRIKAVFSPDNSAKPTAHNRSELDEAALVALSSIHHLDPKLLLTLGSEDFQESSLDDALLKKIIQKHRESAGQWPPTKESVLAFIELTKGIEVH